MADKRRGSIGRKRNRRKIERRGRDGESGRDRERDRERERERGRDEKGQAGRAFCDVFVVIRETHLFDAFVDI